MHCTQGVGGSARLLSCWFSYGGLLVSKQREGTTDVRLCILKCFIGGWQRAFCHSSLKLCTATGLFFYYEMSFTQFQEISKQRVKKKKNSLYNSSNNYNSSVVRTLDSSLKGRGFESLQEWRENFLLLGRLSVLNLIPVSVPPPCYRSSM